MEYTQSIILALLQGITEFLPISSSAHLILLPQLFGWQDQGLAFDIAVHLGTLLAVVVYLRREIAAILPAWIDGWRRFSWQQEGQLGWLIIIATVPVGLSGLFVSEWIEIHLRDPLVIAFSTALFAVCLWWSDRHAATHQGMLRNLGWWQAVFVGGAQALALIPGTSRSGITMTAMLLMGFTRVDAARFSFLLAVPVITLSAAYKGLELAATTEPVAWDLLLLGTSVSALVAFFCIRWFVGFVTRVGMMPFVVYRLLLAAFLWWQFA